MAGQPEEATTSWFRTRQLAGQRATYTRTTGLQQMFGAPQCGPVAAPRPGLVTGIVASLICTTASHSRARWRG